jgi:hypothetical protein
MADDQEAGASALGYERERMQSTAYVLVAVSVGLAGEEGHERIDDHERRAGAADLLLDQVDVPGDTRGSRRLAFDPDLVEDGRPP